MFKFLESESCLLDILRLRSRGLRALFNPLVDELLVFRREFLLALRHLVGGDLFPEQAGLHIARLQCRTRFAAPDHQPNQAHV